MRGLYLKCLIPCATAVLGIAAPAGAQVLWTTQSDFSNWTSGTGGTFSDSAAADLDGSTVNGYGNYTSAGVNQGGGASTGSGLLLTVPTGGGFIELQSGEQVPKPDSVTPAPNTALFSALHSGGQLAVDFTIPDNVTVPTGPYLQEEFNFNDSAGYQQQGLVPVTLDANSSNASGSVTYNGSVGGIGSYTLFQTPVLASEPAGDAYGYFQFGLITNTNYGGFNESIDNIRVVPEPASLGLFAVGACGLLARRRAR